MLVLFTVALLILAIAINVFAAWKGRKGLLLPLVELLDQQSSEPGRSYTLDANALALHGHYGGRGVTFSFELGEDKELSEFHTGLSCNAPWEFDIAKKSSPFGLQCLGKGQNKWNEKFSVSDKLSKAKFLGSYFRGGAGHIGYGEQLVAWTKKPEIRERIEYLMLVRRVDFLVLAAGKLDATYSPYRKRHLDVRNIRAVLGGMQVLARSLERESIGTLWERSTIAGRSPDPHSLL